MRHIDGIVSLILSALLVLLAGYALVGESPTWLVDLICIPWMIHMTAMALYDKRPLSRLWQRWKSHQHR